MEPLPLLPDRWREEAETLARHGCEREADQLRKRAREVEAAWLAYWDEQLTLEEASQECGYAVGSLREMVEQRRIPDLRPEGSQGRIRIRRRDLPRKPPNPTRGRRPQRDGIPAGAEVSAAGELEQMARG